MRRITFALALLVVFAGLGRAQPQYGDLVIATGQGQANHMNGYTAYLDPAKPNTLTRLAIAPFGSCHNWVRMAPNNTDLVFTRTNLGTMPSSGDLVNLQPNGAQTTITRFSGYNTDGYELDHDGQWVLSARSIPLSPKPNFVLGVDHAQGTVTTFATLYTTTWFNEMAIDRDPGSKPYTIACCCLSGTSGPEVLQADRQGRLTTIVKGSVIPPNTAIELHPRSGDYLIGYLTNGNIIRMTKSGVKTTVTAFSANAIKILQDDTCWAAHGGWTSRTILHYDLSANAVLSLFISPIPYGWNLMGIEVYGSRTLVCHQPPAKPGTVSVNLQSRDPAIRGGEQYVLAASLARRPGVKFPNGEWLDLDVTDPLFFTSILGWAPEVFRSFQGTVDAFGNAKAQVNIPPGLPRLGNVAVFVAGVIYSRSNVIQVTNSHWFVLP